MISFLRIFVKIRIECNFRIFIFIHFNVHFLFLWDHKLVLRFRECIFRFSIKKLRFKWKRFATKTKIATVQKASLNIVQLIRISNTYSFMNTFCSFFIIVVRFKQSLDYVFSSQVNASYCVTFRCIIRCKCFGLRLFRIERVIYCF